MSVELETEDVIRLRYVECEMIVVHPERGPGASYPDGMLGLGQVTLCGLSPHCHTAFWNKSGLVEIVIVDSSEREKK